MSVDNFAILAIVDPIWIATTPSGMEIFESQVHVSLLGLPVDRIWHGRSNLQAGVEIYYREHPQFWLILSSQNDPLLGPQFHPRCGQLAAPYLYAHKEPRINFKLCTQI